MTEAVLCIAGHRRPARSLEGLLLCDRHLADIGHALDEITVFHRLLRFEAQLPRGRSGGDAEVHAKQPHAPAPTRLDLMALMDPRTGPMTTDADLPYVPRELEVWTDHIAVMREITPPPPKVMIRRAQWLAGKAGGDWEWSLAQARTEVMSAWLRRHHRWLAGQEMVTDYREHLHRIRSKVAKAVGMEPPPPFAHCYAMAGDPLTECGGPLWQPEDARAVTCGRCGRVYAGTDLVRLRVVAASPETAANA